MLRVVLAPNPSPMTLQGTQTYLVGHQRCVIIDPGPALPAHIDAVAAAVADGVVTSILLTHAHEDHAEAAPVLAARLGAEVRSHQHGLRDHQRIETDAGALLALHTPGHSPDHFSFWWPQEQAIFCGDLMMGGLDTTLVAPPEGELGAYLASLERLATLQPALIYPAHGPVITDPAAALQRYVQHRLQREEQVLTGLSEQPKTADDLTALVYGAELDPGLQPYARAAIDAYLEHMKKHGRVRRGHMGWEKST
jgi:glyoxylase-like metal-dependent hydrolase (beta-lactamase superfamily II)